MNVKNKISKTIAFCALMLLLSDTGYGFTQIKSSSPETPKKIFDSNKGKNFSGGRTPLASSINIGPTETGIAIHVRNGLLVDVLQQVANHTNIQFRVADQLSSQRINVNILAQNWDAAVESLLKDFSKIAVWDKYSRMENVLLLGTNNWESPADPEPQPDDPQVARYQEPKGKNTPSGLSVAKLKQLVQVRPGKAIPANLFADQEIRHYLSLKGINSPNDWEKPNKQRMVLHLAKRELIKLLYDQQTKS